MKTKDGIIIFYVNICIIYLFLSYKRIFFKMCTNYIDIYYIYNNNKINEFHLNK